MVVIYALGLPLNCDWWDAPPPHLKTIYKLKLYRNIDYV